MDPVTVGTMVGITDGVGTIHTVGITDGDMDTTLMATGTTPTDTTLSDGTTDGTITIPGPQLETVVQDQEIPLLAQRQERTMAIADRLNTHHLEVLGLAAEELRARAPLQLILVGEAL